MVVGRGARSDLTQVHGNTHGLAPSDLKALERLYRRRVPFDALTTPELTKSLAEVSYATGRQVGVIVDRSGAVGWVVIGDASKLVLPDLGRFGAAAGRFRGLRLIHTHLRNEPLTRDDLVDLTRLRLDLVAAICLAPDGRPWQVYYAHALPFRAAKNGSDEGERTPPFQQYGPIPYVQLEVSPAEIVTAIEAEFARVARRQVRAKDGRAILVHVCDKRRSFAAEESLR